MPPSVIFITLVTGAVYLIQTHFFSGCSFHLISGHKSRLPASRACARPQEVFLLSKLKEHDQISCYYYFIEEVNSNLD